MAKSASEIVIDPKLCKGCHICIEMCPQSVLAKSKDVDNLGFYLPELINLDACTVCRICELECPDFAIKVVEN